MLSGAALDVVRCVAVLGPTPLGVVAAAVHRTTAEVVRSVQEAIEAEVLDPAAPVLRLCDDELAEAIAASVPAAVQAGLHYAAGRYLIATGGAARLVAHHLGLGVPGVDTETAIWLRRAAHEVGGDDPAGALELLERALTALPSWHPDRDDVALDRVRALIDVGRLADAEAAAQDALAGSPPRAVAARHHASLADMCVISGHNAAAVEHIDAAVASIGDEHPVERARLLARSACLRMWAFDLPGAEAVADRALADARQLCDPIATTMALGTISRLAAFRLDLDAAVAAGEEAVRRARSSGPALATAPHLYFGLALMNADQFDRAGAVLDEGRARCAEVGATWALPKFQSARALVDLFAGNWDDVLADIAASEIVAVDASHGSGFGLLRAVAGLVAVHRGELALAEAAAGAARQAMSQPGADASGVPYLRWLDALLAEANGDAPAALESLRATCDLASNAGVPLVLLWLLPDVARLAQATGRRDVGAWTASMAEGLATTAGTVAGGAVRDAAKGLLMGDAALLERAAAAFASVGRRLDAARADETAGRLAMVSGDAARGETALRRAVAVYHELGADLHGRRARAALRESGVRIGALGPRRRASTGWESLTPAELAVASMVADGRDNRQIAAELVVSKRTVETHLSNLYRKLGVSSRVAIANAARASLATAS